MKFAHSFWSKPLFENKFGNFEDIFKCTLITYAYSVHCIHELNEQIVLYTDKRGSEILSAIPYDEIYIVDVCDDSIHFAAQLKFEALKNMKLGDVLIDGDLFITSQNMLDTLKSKISKNDVVYSYFEPNNIILFEDTKEYYTRLLKLMSSITYTYPYELKNINNLEWFNTSLMVFTNDKLLKEYIRQYEYHKKKLINIDFQYVWPDILIEQYFLTLLTNRNKYKSEPLIEDYCTNIFGYQCAEQSGYIHLWSSKMCKYMEYYKKLKYENPILYNNIKAQIKL